MTVPTHDDGVLAELLRRASSPDEVKDVFTGSAPAQSTRGLGKVELGKLAPCPACGSKNADEFADGTARCEDCGMALTRVGAKAKAKAEGKADGAELEGDLVDQIERSIKDLSAALELELKGDGDADGDGEVDPDEDGDGGSAGGDAAHPGDTDALAELTAEEALEAAHDLASDPEPVEVLLVEDGDDTDLGLLDA